MLRPSACLAFNPITVNDYVFLFNCTPVGQTSDSMMVPTFSFLSIHSAPELCRLLLDPPGFNFSFTSALQWCCMTSQASPADTQHVVSVESSSLVLRDYSSPEPKAQKVSL